MKRSTPGLYTVVGGLYVCFLGVREEAAWGYSGEGRRLSEDSQGYLKR